ncbi:MULTISPECIES: hypothetical protein [unclassified Rhodococcus (in: high G+C Gram-positive bacteria)]|uniref:hypothetical protein n=1 Tax=Rhodococcus sp. SJ-3 TaxID=3454628 RepID=UPI002D9695AA|nr:hypothetical protein [Rhodococcus sp. (in: high G+C Gram-positive bacteria)]
MREKAESPGGARALFDRLATEYRRDPDIEVGTMFRSPGLRIAGKVFAFVGSGRCLIVKLPRHRALEMLDSGLADEVTMGKRTMKEWVSLPVDDDDLDATLATWRQVAGEALEFVGGTPCRESSDE